METTALGSRMSCVYEEMIRHSTAATSLPDSHVASSVSQQYSWKSERSHRKGRDCRDARENTSSKGELHRENFRRFLMNVSRHPQKFEVFIERQRNRRAFQVHEESTERTKHAERKEELTDRPFGKLGELSRNVSEASDAITGRSSQVSASQVMEESISISISTASVPKATREIVSL